MDVLWTVTPAFVPVLSFAVYVLNGGELGVSVAFTVRQTSWWCLRGESLADGMSTAEFSTDSQGSVRIYILPESILSMFTFDVIQRSTRQLAPELQ